MRSVSNRSKVYAGRRPRRCGPHALSRRSPSRLRRDRPFLRRRRCGSGSLSRGRLRDTARCRIRQRRAEAGFLADSRNQWRGFERQGLDRGREFPERRLCALGFGHAPRIQKGPDAAVSLFRQQLKRPSRRAYALRSSACHSFTIFLMVLASLMLSFTICSTSAGNSASLA